MNQSPRAPIIAAQVAAAPVQLVVDKLPGQLRRGQKVTIATLSSDGRRVVLRRVVAVPGPGALERGAVGGAGSGLGAAGDS